MPKTAESPLLDAPASAPAPAEPIPPQADCLPASDPRPGPGELPAIEIDTRLISAEPPGVTLFERLARDPQVPVEKLERLIQLQERILDRDARAAFNRAFAELQRELPIVIEHGRGDKDTTFAPYEDLVEAVTPILHKHGFSLSHRTEWPDKTTVKVVGILTHRDGHARESEFQAAADQTGSKNAIQALGSSRSYGRRYTLCDLLNIATRGEDDDGAKAGKAGRPDVADPEGYDNWLLDLTIVAENGTGALQDTWKKSSVEYRRHLVATDARRWAELKRLAAKVGKE